MRDRSGTPITAGSLLSSAAVYSASNILSAALPFLLLPIITRLLSPAEFGIIGMFATLCSILGAFTGLSVQGAANSRYVDRDRIDYPRYVGACVWVLLLSSAAVFLAVALTRGWLSEWTSVPPFWVTIAVALSAASFLVQIRLGIWLMGRKASRYAIFQVSASAANVGLSLVLLYWVLPNHEGRLWGQFAATVIFAVIASVLLIRGGWIDLRPAMGYMREVLAFGIPLIPHALGGVMLATADRIILNTFLGIDSIGIYMVAVQIGIALGMLTDAFNKSFVPWLYENLTNGGQRAKKQIVTTTWFYFAFALAVAGIVALMAPSIVRVLAGYRYAGSADALGWIALGHAFGGMYLMVTNYIFYTRKTAALGWVTLGCGTISVVLSLLLVPRMGINGAGLAFALGMLCKFALTWVLANRTYPMPWMGPLARLRRSPT